MTAHEGGCTCGRIRYRVTAAPLFVHCCHCSWCQRESGAAFAINALIESTHVTLLRGEPETIETPSNSGRGQQIVRCPACRVAVWSHYSADDEAIAFLRVGTLDDPDECPPDIHIFTSTKQRWVELADSAAIVENYYRRSEYWPAESIARYRAVRAAGRD